MKSKVASGGAKAGPATYDDIPVPNQPAWMGSSIVAIIITVFIGLSAAIGGQWASTVIGIGWGLVIAGLIIAVELIVLAVVVDHMRKAYQQKHIQPPVKPFDLAA